MSNRYSKTFLAAQGTWFKVATAESTFRFLDTAQNLGVYTNDVQNFMQNQLKLRKIKSNAKHNSKLHREHSDISNNLMSLKVADQALVVDEATAARNASREALRATAPSSKSFRNAIFQLNSMSKELADKLDSKNRIKLNHLHDKQKMNNVNSKIPISTSTRIRH